MRRRQFFATPLALAGGIPLLADEEPRALKVTDPRAISGDAVEPKWESGNTVTVGPNKADVVGSDQKAIQGAVDYVARLGGGTVRILPGTYRMRNAVFLRSGVRILGSGLDSILIKEPSVKTKLVADSDWYEQEVTLANPNGFEVGDGVFFHAQNETDSTDMHKRTLVARSGNRFKLDRMLVGNFWVDQDATASSLFAIFDGMNVSDIAIEDIALDGNKANNENLNGNYVGCIFLRESNRIRMRGVTARNFNGDAMSWQVCHDVRVEDCHCHDSAGYGMHAGSGSQRTVAVRNQLERNDIGFFFCWGVRWSVCENNTVLDNRRFGVSIGHKDTDNLIRGNNIQRSGKVGVLFRQENGPAFSPNRNRLEDNRILDSGGGEDGIAVKLEGYTQSVGIARNQIRETRNPAKRIGVKIESEAKNIHLSENRIEGFAQPVVDLRKA